MATTRSLTVLLAVLAAALFPPAGGAAAPCADVPGLAPLLAPGTVLLVGEMHGTEQAPAFVAAAVCAALDASLPVTVGLEVDRADDDAYQAFLRSDGSPAARERLLAAPFWNRDFQDGRGSRAMLGLMESLRGLAARDGASLRLVLIDRPEAGAERDAAMAERVGEAMAAAPGDLFVVLTGNIHNRKTRGMPWNEDLEPMGLRLRRSHPDARIVSLDMAYPGGTAWVCFGQAPSDCEAQEIHGSPAAAGRTGVELLEEPPGDAEAAPYDGRYYTGPLIASPPGVGAGGDG